MAISPEQAKLGVSQPLSEAERQLLADIESHLDAFLYQMCARNPAWSGANTLRCRPGAFTPSMQAEFVQRYRVLGWQRVRITDHRTHYSVQLTAPTP